MAVWFFFVCLVFIPNLFNEAYADPAGDDRDALLAFKDATNINSMKYCIDVSKQWEERDYSTGALVPNSCNWGHVECDSNDRVMRIDLGGCNGITGNLVQELGKLDKLLYMNIYNNRLSGVIPPELGNLISLKQLALDGNLLEGPIPIELANLKNLEYLQLNDNKLNGTVPQGFLGEFPSIKKVNLTSNTDLTGPCTETPCCPDHINCSN